MAGFICSVCDYIAGPDLPSFRDGLTTVPLGLGQSLLEGTEWQPTDLEGEPKIFLDL